MTDTLAPPQPPGVHDVTTQAHSDGAWYATCTCGWHSPPNGREKNAVLFAGQHRRATPPKRKSKAGLLVVVLTGLVGLAILVAAVGGSSSEPTGGSDGGSFYVKAGWTVSRAADLSVDLQRDDGMSKAQAQCTMRAVAGAHTWFEWSSYSAAGQLLIIDDAAAAC